MLLRCGISSLGYIKTELIKSCVGGILRPLWDSMGKVCLRLSTDPSRSWHLHVTLPGGVPCWKGLHQKGQIGRLRPQCRGKPESGWAGGNLGRGIISSAMAEVRGLES